MAKAKVTLNSSGVVDLLTSRGLKTELDDLAEAARERAVTDAPVDTGAYQASIESGTYRDGDREVAWVGSLLPYAATLEARQGYLWRAVEGGGADE